MRTIPELRASLSTASTTVAAAPIDTQPMPILAPPASTAAPRTSMPTVPPLPTASGAATVVRRVEAGATVVAPTPSLPPPPLASAAALAFDNTIVAAPKGPSIRPATSEPTLVAPAATSEHTLVAPAPAVVVPGAAATQQVVTEAAIIAPAVSAAAAVPPPATPRFAPALPTPAQVVTDVLPTIKARDAHVAATPPATPASAGTDAVRPSWAAPAKAAVPAAIKPRRLEYASWWRQWCAAIVDGAGSAAVVFGLVRLAMWALSIKPSTQALIDALHSNVLQLVPVAVAWPLGVALWHGLALAFGGTPGQRLLGLRLVDNHGHSAGPIRLAIRAIVAGTTAVFLVGPTWALLVDGRRRGCGDIVARTVAIHR
jgi:uncharacterized RDD family membrane protein YckC